MAEEAKKQAIEDIKEELAIHGKCFLAFHEELNPIMDLLVEQENRRKSKLSCHEQV